MTIGFFLVQRQACTDPDKPDGHECAGYLLKYAKLHMPQVEVVQFTDDDTPRVSGVDRVLRLPIEPLARLRLKHQSLVRGHWLFLDTDVVIQRDLEKVFTARFDVAVTKRNWPHLKSGVGFTKEMPYNTGVVFSRCPRFWQEAYRLSGELSPRDQHWMGDQIVIGQLAKSAGYRVLEVKGDKFNFPPAVNPDRDDFILSDRMQRKAWIVHYKGDERKALMRKECA